MPDLPWDDAYAMIDIDRFICPKCRDFKFGSSREPDGTWTRRCRGQRTVVHDGVVVIKSCAFSWPAADDWKYMHTVVCASGPDDTFKKTVAELWLRAQAQPVTAAHIIPVPVTDATLRQLLMLAIEGASDRWLAAVTVATSPSKPVPFSDVPFCGGSLTAVIRYAAATSVRVLDRGALVYGLLTLARKRPNRFADIMVDAAHSGVAADMLLQCALFDDVLFP